MKQSSIIARFITFLIFVSVMIWFSLSLMAQNETIQTDAGAVKVENLTGGLNHPWAMVFLPDGRILVTERSGQLRILDQDQKLSDPLEGVPEVFNQGQGGLLDIQLDPDFEQNQFVYLSFSQPGHNGTTASTALGRGKFDNDMIKDFEVIFSQEPKVEGPNHFGGRIVFSPDGNLFLTLGERFKFDPAQNLSNHLGTIVRIQKNGAVPSDNPFIDQPEAEDEIWSYGHRNIEAAAIDLNTNNLWVVEMGPLGGDELNQPEAGRNYGWPVVSWGKHYSGESIPDPPTHPDFADAVIQWTPVISPSGMIFYSGDVFPEWRGSALIGGLTAKGIVRVEVNGKQAQEVERIPLGARIREVVQGPDDMIYVLSDQDDGNIWRISPLE
ncbi:MAG: PQQ-dependent sugar dehydrogenase [Candidatus Cyclobacteriaceae bacterium M3_2C_046]